MMPMASEDFIIGNMYDADMTVTKCTAVTKYLFFSSSSSSPSSSDPRKVQIPSAQKKDDETSQ